MDKNNVMYAGFLTLSTLSLCVFEGRKGGSWCGTMAT